MRASSSSNLPNCSELRSHIVTNAYPIPNRISFASLHFSNMHLLAMLTFLKQSQTYEEAVIKHLWQEAMQKKKV